MTLTKWIVEQLDQVKPNLLYGLLMRVLELDLRPLTAIPADTVLYKVIVLFRCTAQICCTLDGGKSLVMPLISVCSMWHAFLCTWFRSPGGWHQAKLCYKGTHQLLGTLLC